MADSSKETYDALVVGSGASGGWAAKRLSEAGLKIALVEAGRQQSDKNFTEHMPAFQLKYRDRAPEVIRKTRPVQKDCYACMEYNYDWFANDLEEPYTTPEGKPFSWQGRLRVTGGRTNVWGRQSYRLSDLDFKAASHDGYGEDWPLGYQDLAPYYDIVEDYVGITGIPEGVYELPDGKFQPPMGLTCAEELFRNRLKVKFGRTATLGRSANLTKPTNGRAPCHYCGPCERGCVTHSYFNSFFTTVADALATGRCTLISNAMVYKILMDSDRNRARGVLYIDRITREPKEVFAKVVVLCAQSLESVRILFNSATRQYAAGLANSSGVLGHYLMDHATGGGAFGALPELAAEKPTLNRPDRPDGIYVIRFRNTQNGPRSGKFLRGYGYQGGGSSGGFSFWAPGFGQAYKQAVMHSVAGISLGGFAECLARWDNYVEIDPQVVDAFGIPVLRVNMTYGENEIALVRDMADTAAEMLEGIGAKYVRSQYDPSQPGWAIHEVGIARMGDDPKKSVLNQFQQSHDVKNLFVMDGSCFTSTACQNPTLTIMALAVRSCDYLLKEMKSGNV
jgi:glucoside 3-dehydrogenase (cytochrome c) catalytic subunit